MTNKIGLRAEDIVPPHDYVVGGTGACLVCGRTPVDPLHDDSLGDEITENLRESLPAKDADLLENADGDSTDDDTDEEGQTGVMVALFPSQEVAQALRLPGGEKAKNIHLTLAYLGDSEDVERPADLIAAVTEYARAEGKPLSGEVAGLGVFTAGSGVVTYASVDLPGLPAFRQGLVQVLSAAGFPASEEHGFTPHMTLAYADRRTADVPNVPLHFDTITVAVAGRRHVIPLGGEDDGEYAITLPGDTEPAALVAPTLSGQLGGRLGVLRGWFGAPNTEKAETFYFEHQWKPVPGHPAEVATCDVCGLNRYSDEHKMTEGAGVHKKHKYVHPNGEQHPQTTSRGDLGYGYAYPPCATCGLSKDDPDHEDDADEVPGVVNSGGTTAPHAKATGTSQVASTTERGRTMKNGSYPITDQKSANSAWKLRNHSKEYSEEQVVAHIRAACKALGLHFPGDSEKADEDQPDIQRAFLADVNGRTLLTAPASLDTHGWEKALTPNPHFMWMQGRFVGGEEPNRNKAFWSTADLEMGEPTVAHGPLNWLHESRHIIGTIADQKLVKPSAEQAAEGNVPYIAAVAGIWKWVYPDEAWVVEQASDAGKLWYSMECISDRVECVGDNGCGANASYSDYMKGAGKACNHMKERSAVRRFVDPTFLGGAVIVPPVRPGWADADARVMAEAASLAEKSFEQVHPDLSASEWELLMAQVVKFARP